MPSGRGRFLRTILRAVALYGAILYAALAIGFRTLWLGWIAVLGGAATGVAIGCVQWFYTQAAEPLSRK